MSSWRAILFTMLLLGQRVSMIHSVRDYDDEDEADDTSASDHLTRNLNKEQAPLPLLATNLASIPADADTKRNDKKDGEKAFTCFWIGFGKLFKLLCGMANPSTEAASGKHFGGTQAVWEALQAKIREQDSGTIGFWPLDDVGYWAKDNKVVKEDDGIMARKRKYAPTIDDPPENTFIGDGGDPGYDQFHNFLEYMKLRSATVVHCGAGWGRTGLYLIAGTMASCLSPVIVPNQQDSTKPFVFGHCNYGTVIKQECIANLNLAQKHFVSTLFAAHKHACDKYICDAGEFYNGDTDAVCYGPTRGDYVWSLAQLFRLDIKKPVLDTTAFPKLPEANVKAIVEQLCAYAKAKCTALGWE